MIALLVALLEADPVTTVARPNGPAVAVLVMVGERSLTEARAAFVNDLFAWLDADGDGVLLPADVEGWSLPRATGENVPLTFEPMDTNADGRVDRAEFRAHIEKAVGSPVAVQIKGTPDDLQVVNDELARRLERVRPLDLLAAFDDDEDGAISFVEILGGRANAVQKPPKLASTPRASTTTLTIDLLKGQASTRPEIPGENWTVNLTPTAIDRMAAIRGWVTTQFKGTAGVRAHVTREQAKEAEADSLALLHPMADRNRDGKLTADELAAYFDLHERGLLTLATIEFTDTGLSLFDVLDANGDGRLSAKELAVGKPKEIAPTVRVRVLRGPVGAKAGAIALTDGKPMDAAVVRRPMVPRWFSAMDRDGNDVVTMAEFLGPVALFRKLDLNGDGVLTADEAF